MALMKSDAVLMGAVARRDGAALGKLYDRYGSQLYALCLRILRDGPDAEEVLDDVFWEVWRRPERYDATRGSAMAYLITLARSRSIDRLRARRASRSTPLDEGSADPIVAKMPDGETSTPLVDVELGQRRSAVRRAIAELSDDQRRAIEMSFYDGLSHSEIASSLDEPLGTVKSRIRSGLIRLSGSLRSVYGGEVPDDV